MILSKEKNDLASRKIKELIAKNNVLSISFYQFEDFLLALDIAYPDELYDMFQEEASKQCQDSIVFIRSDFKEHFALKIQDFVELFFSNLPKQITEVHIDL